MRVQDPASGDAMHIRRITLLLKEPTRDGDTELHLLSNVPAAEARAGKLAVLYGKRWSMETAFFEITTTLSCEIQTFGDPKAALFAFCLALVAYNAVSILNAALRLAHRERQGNEALSSD